MSDELGRSVGVSFFLFFFLLDFLFFRFICFFFFVFFFFPLPRLLPPFSPLGVDFLPPPFLVSFFLEIDNAEMQKCKRVFFLKKKAKLTTWQSRLSCIYMKLA